MTFKSRLNKRGDIPITILVIGIVLACSVALFSFISSETYVRNSFTGIKLTEYLSSQIEQDDFYKIQGFAGIKQESDIRTAINYAKEQKNGVDGRKCNCGENCNYYAELISSAASSNGIDPILLLALMMQESTCVVNAASIAGSIGLMQVDDSNCGAYGLPKDRSACVNELINNPKLNIEIGARILKGKYDTYKDGRKFAEACLPENKEKFYTGWEAALRGYNGWGCYPGLSSQDYFVEEVMKRYNTLKKTATGNYAEETRTEGILFWIKEITAFSVEYKGTP